MLLLLGGVPDASAQRVAIPGIPFRLGSDVSTVRSALGTDLMPELMGRNSSSSSNLPDPSAGKRVLHLRTQGIWVFFDLNGKAENIRLDAPFPYAVNGVRVGDSVKKLKAELGNPERSWEAADKTAYRYPLDETATVVFHADTEVEIIFVLPRR